MNSCLIIPAVNRAGRFRGLTHAFRTLGWTALAAGMLGQAQAQSRPAISSFTPAKAPTTALVTINGSNFHRSSLGTRWTGSPPYRVQFFNGSQPLEAVPTFVSKTQIRVVVPNNASAGQSPLRLRQNGVVFNTSGTAFTVVQTTTTTPPTTTPPTTTPPPTTTATTLRLVNNTQYNTVSLSLNGAEQFSPDSGVLSGSTVNLATTPGSKTLVAGLGFVLPDGSRDIWFTFTRSFNVTAGQTATQTFSRITVGQLLTMGSASTTWNGTFFDDNGAPHLARFVFSSNGSWQFFIDGAARGSGTLTEVSWPNSSPTVTFRINSTLPTITISHPFGRFLFRNGPPSFPIIQYVKQ